jgi:hypothetical protein
VLAKLLAYPWYDLGNGEWSANFTSDGSYSRWMLQLSVSGVEVGMLMKKVGRNPS